MIIYMAKNKVNGKIYIGQTVKSLETRRGQHESATRKDNNKCFFHFHNALKRYGIDNFEWSIIDKASSIEELNEKEQAYIEQYESCDQSKGYNLNSGGGSYKRTEISRMLDSINRTGEKRSPETCRKIGESKKGVFVNDKHPLWREDLNTNLIIDLRKKGETLQNIARKLNCSRRAIEKRLEIDAPEILSKTYLKSIRKIKRPLINKVTKEQVIDLKNKGYSNKAIMRELKISNNALQARLK